MPITRTIGRKLGFCRDLKNEFIEKKSEKRR